MLLLQTQHRFAIKSIDESARRFTGLASTWDLDFGMDVIRRGAFAKTLGDWRSSNGTRNIHLIDSHDYRSVTAQVGTLVEAKETAAGLDCVFEMNAATDARSEAVWSRLVSKAVNGLSIGYEALSFEFEKPEGADPWDVIRVIKELRLLEVSVVLWPMNDNARVKGLRGVLDALPPSDVGKFFQALSTEQRAAVTAALAQNPALVTPKAGEEPTAPEKSTPAADTTAAVAESQAATESDVADLDVAIALLELRSAGARELFATSRSE